MTPFSAVLQALDSEAKAALVTIVKTRGSCPRELGAWMVMRPSGGFSGSIGGGALEWRAQEMAFATFDQSVQPPSYERRFVLGPDLGQCCGGVVHLRFSFFTLQDRADVAERAAAQSETLSPLLLFGAGHVGRALVMALAPLPFTIDWIDSRANIFPRHIPANTRCYLHSEPPQHLASAPAGSFILIMTHDHALDFAIAAAALQQERFPFVGVIGSQGKAQRFKSRWRAAPGAGLSLERFICPIGIAGIEDKSPAAIAASVVAQLLLLRLPKTITSPEKVLSP